MSVNNCKSTHWKWLSIRCLLLDRGSMGFHFRVLTTRKKFLSKSWTLTNDRGSVDIFYLPLVSPIGIYCTYILYGFTVFCTSCVLSSTYLTVSYSSASCIIVKIFAKLLGYTNPCFQFLSPSYLVMKLKSWLKFTCIIMSQSTWKETFDFRKMCFREIQ